MLRSTRRTARATGLDRAERQADVLGRPDQGPLIVPTAPDTALYCLHATGANTHLSLEIGDKKPVSDIQYFAVEEIGVAVVPPAAGQVLLQPGQARADDIVADLGEQRDTRPHLRIKVGLGPALERGQEAVGAVVGDRDRLDAGPSQQRHQPVHRHRSCAVEHRRLRQVLLQQPEPVIDIGVEREDDNPLTGETAQLPDTGPQVTPMVHGQQGHHRIGRVVCQGNRLRRRLQNRRRRNRTLSDHHRTGLHGPYGL